MKREQASSLTPGTLIDGARMYAAAADAVTAQFPNALHVISQLLGTSIELALKAHLRNVQYSENDLRTLGHNLPKLYEEAQAHGLAYTGSRNFVLTVLNALYQPREFVYPKEAMLSHIAPRRLRQMAFELIEFSFAAVHGRDRYLECRSEPGLAILPIILKSTILRHGRRPPSHAKDKGDGESCRLSSEVGSDAA
jgi:hypothetical protein